LKLYCKFKPKITKHVISDEEKNKLIPIPFKECRNKDENSKCSITQEEFHEDEMVIQLPCDHCFCEEDIMNWLTKEKGECPVCRYKFECVELREQSVEPEHDEQVHVENYIQPNNFLFNYFNYINNNNFTNNSYINIPETHDNNDHPDID